MSSYGKILLGLRKRSKYSRRELSSLTGVSSEWIHDVERGRIVSPGVDKFQIVLHALGSSLSVLEEGIETDNVYVRILGASTLGARDRGLVKHLMASVGKEAVNFVQHVGDNRDGVGI